MTISLVLGILSLATRIHSEELVYAAGSIAAAMLVPMFRRKRRIGNSHERRRSSSKKNRQKLTLEKRYPLKNRIAKHTGV